MSSSETEPAFATNSPASSSVEIELKFDVDAATSIPDFSLLNEVATVVGPLNFPLSAEYFDTAELSLVQAKTALRRRSGGDDAGWHVKGKSVAGARREDHWSLEADQEVQPGELVPEPIKEYIAPLAAGPFIKVAEIRNNRVAYRLFDDAGVMLAEFVDDHVSAKSFLSGNESQWREWELELGGAFQEDTEQANSFLQDAAALILSSGARNSAKDSKLQRVLES